MTTLWPRNRPLNQPPHAGRIGMQPEHAKPCPLKTEAEFFGLVGSPVRVAQAKVLT